MGTYDVVRCLAPLPELPGDHREGDWQTKSFDCHLERYLIREDGTLWKSCAGGAAQQVWLTGEVCFYTSYGELMGEESHRGWVECVALYRRGQLLFVDVVKIDKGER